IIKKEKGLGSSYKPFKGCNCKRTKCQKNFCECYKNSKHCTELCKCIDCLNVSVDVNDTPLLDVTKTEDNSYSEQLPEETYIIENEIPIKCYTVPAKKKNLNVLTPDIIESTIECVIAQAEESQKDNVPTKVAELMIIEEFGRCLEEIRRITNMQNILS
ncbi:Tesmin, partial [Pseudolycoriella hygida]